MSGVLGDKLIEPGAQSTQGESTIDQQTLSGHEARVLAQ
jgi:hypothetical protein